MSAAISFSIERLDRLTKRFCVIVVSRHFLISFSFEKLRPSDATVSESIRKILGIKPRLWSPCQTLAGF